MLSVVAHDPKVLLDPGGQRWASVGWEGGPAANMLGLGWREDRAGVGLEEGCGPLGPGCMQQQPGPQTQGRMTEPILGTTPGDSSISVSF